MAGPLLLTKVSLPLLRPLLVPRKTVLRQFGAGLQQGHLLTLVAAPAGYGKTTAVRMWVEEARLPVAWVSLEKSDNDLKQFLAYLLIALQQVGDDLGHATLEIVESAPELDLQQILGLLINDLYHLDQPIILVLEDYHQIENTQIDQFLALLLNQAVANLHLVITTREDPNLPLTRLRVRNQLTEIRAGDLSFSLDEAADFFANVMGVHLSNRETAILKNRTEGWVAGLQLAALSLKESADPPKFVEAFRGTHRHILDYLIEEVLNSQPEAVQTFLRRTSILDQLSPALCEAVTGEKASRSFLRDLESNNLFLVALDEERIWYRYHALFAELLKNQLMQTEPELVDNLHERAAAWHEKNSFIQQAIEHALQSANSSKVVNLIEQHVLPMLYRGEVATVAGWFDRVPAALIHASPLLCIGKAWSLALMQRQTHTEAVEQALQAAVDALNRTNAAAALRNLVAGHTASIQAYLMQSPTFAAQNPEVRIAIAHKAQQLLPQTEKALRSVNALNIGHGCTALADLPAAESAYQQALEDGIAGGNFYAAIYGPINLTVIALIKGQLNEALPFCESNLDRFNRLLAGQRFPPIGDLYILKGSILLEQNQLTAAEQALTQGLALVRWTGEYEAHLRGYGALARLRAIQHDEKGMLEHVKSLEETRPEVALYAQVLRHRLSLSHWDANPNTLAEAQRWVTQAAISFADLSTITGIDPLRRIHFQVYLSAAHILARLAAANPDDVSLPAVQRYLAQQETFAATNQLLGWLIELWLVRALLYHVQGRAEDAFQMLQAALRAAAPQGYFRIFLDEGDLIRPLLASVAPHLKEHELSAFVKRLLAAMPAASPKVQSIPRQEGLLSDRELDVLRLLASGQSYKEIGEQLFLSLNTVQFHVKNIYSKLLVNKRVQAIEKARAMQLI
ncbi:MAG: LuxR C-terminal-related transcriptional regulator [Caldilineaceae bacterium]